MTKPPLGITARCKVLQVVDGDTLDIELRLPMRIRLLDCWCPESRTTDLEEKAKGLAAKKAMVELTVNRLYGQVFVPTAAAQSVSDVLTLNRLLGKVWMDGQDTDLSTSQVVQGYASSKKGGKLGT
jgi:endonuclease YncB( thermonuclease family)